ncbi:MAG: HD domain-containing protein [Spirochaetia bacterium]|nr:HD domain-containing protein [Spirochaetia bacterium]
MRKFPISSTVTQFASYFTKRNFSLFIVGGCVRDWVLHRDITDMDFATDATPLEVTSLFYKVIPTGIDHGTVTVLFKGEQFEVTTFRSDDEYLDNRRPKSVSFIGSIEEDLKRRDFTMNALAVNVISGELIDLHEGLIDIQKRLIRAIGDPETRFSEDALRMMRACRFASTLEFTIEENTLSAIKKLHSSLSTISGERIHIELFKILASRRPSIAFKIMDECGILALLFPELSIGKGVSQKGEHKADVLDHNLYALDNAPQSDVLIRLSALLHDIGKPVTKKIDEYGNVTFYDHEKASLKMAKELMLRIKCSNAEIHKVLHLIKHHMLHYTSDMSDAAIRRFIARVGIEHIDDLFALRIADGIATNGINKKEILVEFKKRIEKELLSQHAFSMKDLKVNGNDLIGIGIPKGPVIGLLLKELFETVLDDPSNNEKEKLLTIAERFYKLRVNLF